jgi:hypothetical protein
MTRVTAKEVLAHKAATFRMYRNNPVSGNNVLKSLISEALVKYQPEDIVDGNRLVMAINLIGFDTEAVKTCASVSESHFKQLGVGQYTVEPLTEHKGHALHMKFPMSGEFQFTFDSVMRRSVSHIPEDAGKQRVYFWRPHCGVTGTGRIANCHKWCMVEVKLGTDNAPIESITVHVQ